MWNLFDWPGGVVPTGLYVGEEDEGEEEAPRNEDEKHLYSTCEFDSTLEVLLWDLSVDIAMRDASGEKRGGGDGVVDLDMRKSVLIQLQSTLKLLTERQSRCSSLRPDGRMRGWWRPCACLSRCCRSSDEGSVMNRELGQPAFGSALFSSVPADRIFVACSEL